MRTWLAVWANILIRSTCLASASVELQCGIGIQTAAKSFFNQRRIDTARFDARRDCCAGAGGARTSALILYAVRLRHGEAFQLSTVTP